MDPQRVEDARTGTLVSILRSLVDLLTLHTCPAARCTRVRCSINAFSLASPPALRVHSRTPFCENFLQAEGAVKTGGAPVVECDPVAVVRRGLHPRGGACVPNTCRCERVARFTLLIFSCAVLGYHAPNRRVSMCARLETFQARRTLPRRSFRECPHVPSQLQPSNTYVSHNPSMTRE